MQGLLYIVIIVMIAIDISVTLRLVEEYISSSKKTNYELNKIKRLLEEQR